MANAENEFDLRMPHDDDYPDVAYVREQEAELIGQWIADYQPNVNMSSPSYKKYNLQDGYDPLKLV